MTDGSARGRPRLLIVHASADLYGSDRACLAIARAAVAEGFEVETVVPWSGPLARELREAGAKTHVFDPLVLRRRDLRGWRAAIAPFRWIRALTRLHRFAGRGSFDIVHSNCITTLGGSYLARRWRVPHVWHVHELFGDSATSRFVFERLLGRADWVIAASGAVADQFQSSETRRRCVVAHTGADVPEDLATSRPLGRRPPVVVCVGRLNAWKGQDDLIRAVALLRDRGIEVRLQVVGEVFGAEHHFRDRLQALTHELHVEDRVAFLGERSDALELIARADIAVVPSATPEPFGMVVVEAMALGRPLIATDAGGPREIVSDGTDGLLVPPRSPQALAAAIARLIEDPEAARALGHAARQTASRFTSGAMAARVLDVYREALAAR